MFCPKFLHIPTSDASKKLNCSVEESAKSLQQILWSVTGGELTLWYFILLNPSHPSVLRRPAGLLCALYYTVSSVEADD